MSFVNPNILARIFGQDGAINQMDAGQQQQLASMLSGAGAGMTQAVGQPGAGFAQALGGGAQGMMQGQQQAQQQQMNQMRMQQAQREMERQERLGKIMGDILSGGGRRPDFASQVDAQLPQAPQLGPGQASPMAPQGGVQASRFAGGPDPQAWERMFPDLKASVIQKESGGRQFGPDGNTLTSSAGAQGMMQIMPGTGPDAAELAGLPWDPDRMANDPEYNEALGTAYLDHLGVRYQGDPVLASTAYNWGMGNVDRHIDRVGDPRRGEVSHEEWANSIPVEEARDYATTVGLPILGQAQQVQAPTQAPQRPRPRMNGYQQGMQQQHQGSDPLAGIPPETRQFLALMEPQDAIKTIVQMQTRGEKELPADVRSALFMAGGDEEAARRIMLQGQQGDDLTAATRTAMQKAELFRQADPSLSPSEALNLALSRNRVSRDPVTGQVDIVDIHTGQRVGRGNDAMLEVQDQQQEQAEADVDVSQAFGAPSVIANVTNTLFDVFGADLPRPEVEQAIRRVTSLGIQGDVLLSEQFTGRVSNQLLNMIGELKAKPKSFFEGPARGRTSLEEMNRLIGRDLERQQRIAADESQGPQSRQRARAAVEALTDYQSELTSVLDAWGSFGRDQGQQAGSDDDDVEALINRWAN